MARRKDEEPRITEEDREKYGEPVRVETVPETGEVFVIWRKPIIHPDYKEERERQYFITRWNPRKGVHEEAGHLNVWYQPSARGEVRMAHVEVEKKFRRRGIATKLHQVMQEDHKGKSLWLQAVPGTEKVHEKAGYVKEEGRAGYEGLVPMHRPAEEPPVQARIKPKPTLGQKIREMLEKRKKKRK